MAALLPILKALGMYLLKIVMTSASAAVAKEIIFSILEYAVKSTENKYDDRILAAMQKEMDKQDLEQKS